MATKRRRRKRLGRPRSTERPPGSRSSRERILAAASHLFSHRGTRATTMQDVAERAGFTVGAIYKHFHGKPDLLLAVVAVALERIPLLQSAADARRGSVAQIAGVT